MRIPRTISRLFQDPPPRFVFELSEDGIAVAQTGHPPSIAFQPLEPDVLSVSPVRDNVLRMEALAARVQALAGPTGKKRQGAVLILPDFCVRVVVLDFDAFPPEPEQQLSLVRFRLRKSLPFDVESAGLSYYPQPNGTQGTRRDVVVAVAPMEILARYEAPFRAAGLHPGLVTTSALCALELMRGAGLAVLVKLAGRALTLAVAGHGALKLVRTLELADGSAAEIVSHLYPTFAYIEDHLDAKPEKVLVCGPEPLARQLLQECEGQTGIPVEPLRSRFGVPHYYDAGLLGYLEAAEELSK
jgi:type IV pilus assembly protein PilM